MGNGTGSSTSGNGFALHGPGGFNGYNFVADLNGDGILDVGVLGSNTLLIYLGEGGGTFAPPFAIDRILIEQAAANDPRPIDPSAIDEEINRQIAQWGCRSSFDREQMRPLAERNLRLQRTRREMLASAVKPTVEEIEGFFSTHRDKFPRPEMFHASHIVKYVNHEQSEETAEAGIMLALSELEGGVAFAEVADRRSDCKDKGGDLGEFPAGHMVEDFEEAIRELEPGQRSDIFTTPFGFHIAILHSKRPAGLADFEDVRAGIESVMTYACEDEAYQRSIAEMRARADIRWIPDAQAAAS